MDEKKANEYKLFVEGEGLLAVMGTRGECKPLADDGTFLLIRPELQVSMAPRPHPTIRWKSSQPSESKQPVRLS
jgi:hypothetical protein